MPLFEFICDACSNRFEKLVKSRETELPGCPACGSSEVRKLISTFSSTAASPAHQCGSSG